MTTVGIVDTAAYAPEQVQTAEEIATLSGIPAAVIREKFGLDSKHIAGPAEHVSDLAARAAGEILERQPAHPLGALIYMGSPYRDFPVWSAAPKVQQLLGAAAAGSLAFDVQGVSAGTPISLQVATALILANPAIDPIRGPEHVPPSGPTH